MPDHISAQADILKAAVGTATTVRLGQICNQNFSRFAMAAGIDASVNAEGPDVAPHLYLSSVMGWQPGPPETDLGPDGTSPADTRGFPVTGVRLMGAGQDLEFHTPVRSGMLVTETTRLDDVRLKRGSTGQFLTLHLTREFRDDDGTLLVTCRETFIGR